MEQLKTPGRVHRLERYAEAQLPAHGQYIPAGTVYFAELEDPLDFGSEEMTPQAIAQEIKKAYPVYADVSDDKIAEGYRSKYGIYGKVRAVLIGASIGFIGPWLLFCVLRWIIKGFAP